MQISNMIIIQYHHVSFTEVTFCKNHLLLCPWFCLDAGCSSHCQIRGQNDLGLGCHPQAIPLKICSKVTINDPTTKYKPSQPNNSPKKKLFRFKFQRIIDVQSKLHKGLVDLRTKPMLFQWQHQQQRKRRHH